MTKNQETLTARRTDCSALPYCEFFVLKCGLLSSCCSVTVYKHAIGLSAEKQNENHEHTVLSVSLSFSLSADVFILSSTFSLFCTSCSHNYTFRFKTPSSWHRPSHSKKRVSRCSAKIFFLFYLSLRINRLLNISFHNFSLNYSLLTIS